MYRFTVLPVVYYTPETRLAFGGYGIVAFRSKKHPDQLYPSQVQFCVAYTINQQSLIYLPFRIYLQKDKYTAYGEMGYYKYSYYFYGIGNQQPADYKELYKVNYPRIRLNFLAKLGDHLYGGVRYYLEDYQVGETEPGKQLMTDPGITGRKGGVTSGIGPAINIDTRDNLFLATKGWFVDAAMQFYAASVGSQFNYTRYTVDVTKYMTIKKNNAIAINLFSDFVQGDAPFNQLALLGGSRKMRGYYEGRYRDKNLLALGAEYRLKVYKRFGTAVFANAGSVNRSIQDLTSFIRTSYGAGIRYAINPKERINIRFDAGFGNKSSGYYFTIGEAF